MFALENLKNQVLCMIRRRKGKFLNQGEEDPMAGTSNLVDAMFENFVIVLYHWSNSSSVRSPSRSVNEYAFM